MDKYSLGVLFFIFLSFVIAILTIKVKPVKELGIGYKTPMSLKNNNTWVLSNKFASRYMLVCAVILLVCGCFFLIYLEPKKAFISTSMVLTVTSVSVIPVTEIFLRIIFNKKGEIKKINYEKSN